MNGKARRYMKKGGKVPKTPDYAEGPWPRGMPKGAEWTKLDAYWSKPYPPLTDEEFAEAMRKLNPPISKAQ